VPDNDTDPLSLPYLLSAPETFYCFFPSSGQSMVNIGGRKFLVIPRPQMDLDSPPPSPPPAAADRGGDRLPVLLQPADSSDDTPRLNPEPHVSPQKNLVSLLPDCSIIKRMKEYFHIRRYGSCLFHLCSKAFHLQASQKGWLTTVYS
jgi:hypothetical protein